MTSRQALSVLAAIGLLAPTIASAADLSFSRPPPRPGMSLPSSSPPHYPATAFAAPPATVPRPKPPKVPTRMIDPPTPAPFKPMRPYRDPADSERAY